MGESTSNKKQDGNQIRTKRERKSSNSVTEPKVDPIEKFTSSLNEHLTGKSKDPLNGEKSKRKELETRKDYQSSKFRDNGSENQEEEECFANLHHQSSKFEGDNNDDSRLQNNMNDDDYLKVFLSRVPKTMDEETVKECLENEFGLGSVCEVALVREKFEDEKDGKSTISLTKGSEKIQHKGFGYVSMISEEKRDKILEIGFLRTNLGRKKHIIYICPIDRINQTRDEGIGENNRFGNKNPGICFLWSKFRCPYGNACKFSHTGEGGCINNVISHGTEAQGEKKKQKCFSFKSKGKCKLGTNCPFSHDIKKACDFRNENDNDEVKSCNTTNIDLKSTREKDCINWKTKGKCRKGDKCPYRHEDSLRLAIFEKKQSKLKQMNNTTNLESSEQPQKPQKKRRNEKSQPLSIRVFGLNYETKKEDIHKYFEHCGPIREVTFPTFEDSGRSRGYCGLLFQSPKAVQKACELDGHELNGRWLSIQAGKMFLRQWEEREKKREVVNSTDSNKPLIGEFGQKVKRRKKHGYKD
mmetsp:Transcript_9310/g.13216  ORF Transcript_9310/g.13216 Transcript_9310/m.13216 type:complete len:526 (+) Transcript_9310:61-1638(+)